MIQDSARQQGRHTIDECVRIFRMRLQSAVDEQRFGKCGLVCSLNAGRINLITEVQETSIKAN